MIFSTVWRRTWRNWRRRTTTSRGLRMTWTWGAITPRSSIGARRWFPTSDTPEMTSRPHKPPRTFSEDDLNRFIFIGGSFVICTHSKFNGNHIFISCPRCSSRPGRNTSGSRPRSSGRLRCRTLDSSRVPRKLSPAVSCRKTRSRPQPPNTWWACEYK